MAAQPPTTEEEKAAALEPSLRFLLEGEEVPLKYMAKIWDLGFRTTRLFAKYDSAEERVKDGFGRDMELRASDGPEARLNVCRLLSAWESCAKRIDVRGKMEADASVEGLPRSWPKPDHLALREAFGKAHYELNDKTCPAEYYLEETTDQLEQGEFKVETLTQVVCREDVVPGEQGATVGKDGVLKIRTRGHAEAKMPTSPEELRARLKIWGHKWCMLRLKHSHRSNLKTAMPQRFVEYTDYLLGDDILGLEARNDRHEVVARPSLMQVMSYDYRVRKKFVDHLNIGMDVAAALKKAMDDPVVKERYFTTPTAAAALAPPTRERSRSPARLVDKWGKGEQKPRNAFDHRSGGRGFDDRRGGPHAAWGGGGKGGGKGGGGKGGESGLHSVTPDGKKICYKFNNAAERCRGPCPFLHVCRRCFGKHPVHMCGGSGGGSGGGGGSGSGGGNDRVDKNSEVFSGKDAPRTPPRKK